MGLGKKIAYGVYERVRRDRRLLKKIFIGAGVLAAGGLVIAGLMIYFIAGAVKNFASSPPDLELVALRELITTRAIVITDAQREQLKPLLEELSKAKMTPAEREAVKNRLFGLLEPSQRKQVDEWKAGVARKAEEFTSSPQRLIAFIERATGVSMKPVRDWLGALSAWWKMKKPGDDVQGLQEAVGEGK